MRTYEERREAQILSFTQCAKCSYNIVTGEGERNCNYGECANLPDELDVLCPQCNYNFFTREGQPGCGEFATCDYALNEAPAKVAMLHRWLALHQEPAATGQ